MAKDETAKKCEAIVRMIVELANEKGIVSFEEDMGGNSLTILVGQAHTHVGMREAPFEQLVENLYNSLHGGPGLSWYDPSKDKPLEA